MCILCKNSPDFLAQRVSSIEICIDPDNTNATICYDHASLIAAGFESLLQDANVVNDIKNLKNVPFDAVLADLFQTHGLSTLADLKFSVLSEMGGNFDRSQYLYKLYELCKNTAKVTDGKKKATPKNLYVSPTEKTKDEVHEASTSIARNPREVKAYLDRFIVGQGRAKEALSVALSDHFRRINNMDNKLFRKSNILIIGPSGTGKTLLGEKLAEIADVPFVAFDASSLTAEGYQGNSVNDVLKALYDKAGRNLELTQKGIIYLDEIDKIASHQSARVDVGGACVQEQLLRMLQGSEVTIEVGSSPAFKQEISIDTRNILFICSGAFEGLDKIVEEKKSIGFAEHTADTALVNKGVPTTKDLIKYGMDRQFLGRFSVITSVDSLTETDLRAIITKPEDAILKEYQAQFATEGIKLKLTSQALDELSKAALEENVGARGVRRLFEGLLQPYKFDILAYKAQSDELKIGKQDVLKFLNQGQA